MVEWKPIFSWLAANVSFATNKKLFSFQVNRKPLFDSPFRVDSLASDKPQQVLTLVSLVKMKSQKLSSWDQRKIFIIWHITAYFFMEDNTIWDHDNWLNFLSIFKMASRQPLISFVVQGWVLQRKVVSLSPGLSCIHSLILMKGSKEVMILWLPCHEWMIPSGT